MQKLIGGLGLAIACAAAAPAAAHADDATTVATTVGAAPDGGHRHALYVELLGKGGLWGVGYDYLLAPRVAIGATASAFQQDDERVLSLSPYLAIYPLGVHRHRAFIQVGPELVRFDRMSPVPEWPGQTSSGIGGEASVGYELRTRILVRTFAMATVGKGGISPWVGFSFGVTL